MKILKFNANFYLSESKITQMISKYHPFVVLINKNFESTILVLKIWKLLSFRSLQFFLLTVTSF
jgi:hypothetical protein